MINHPTTDTFEQVDVTAIVLVGPPASGKSTLRALLSDYNVVGCDLESHHHSGKLIDGQWKDTISETIREAYRSKPHLACIEGPITNDEVDYIRLQADNTLVVNVDVPSESDRISRYVEREITESEPGVVTNEKIAELETNSFRRHHYEAPYPQHDVSILNTDDTSTSELSSRCATLVSVLSDITDITGPTPPT